MFSPRIQTHKPAIRGIFLTVVISSSRIWDTGTGQCLRTLVHEDNPPVTNVCFSPNGRFVLAWSLDSSIRLWDYVSGSVKKTYQGHRNKRFSIGGGFAVLPEAEDNDGEEKEVRQAEKRFKPFVVSASEDGDIVLWDVKTKEIVQRLGKVHDETCFWVDCNGDTMVSCGNNGKIVVFKHQPLKRKKTKKLEAAGANGHVNGVAGDREGEGGGDKTVPDETNTDDELQRQVKAEAGSPPVAALKEEQL